MALLHRCTTKANTPWRGRVGKSTWRPPLIGPSCPGGHHTDLPPAALPTEPWGLLALPHSGGSLRRCLRRVPEDWWWTGGRSQATLHSELRIPCLPHRGYRGPTLPRLTVLGICPDPAPKYWINKFDLAAERRTLTIPSTHANPTIDNLSSHRHVAYHLRPLATTFPNLLSKTSFEEHRYHVVARRGHRHRPAANHYQSHPRHISDGCPPRSVQEAQASE